MMSANNDMLRTNTGDFRLRADIMALMLKGAGYAALLCVVVGFMMWALYAIGLLLPEESRDTSDPTPLSYNLTVDADQVG
jgi:hypothetical protein